MPFSSLAWSCRGCLVHSHEDLHTDPVGPSHPILLIILLLSLILLDYSPDSQAEPLPMPSAAQCATVTETDDNGRVQIELGGVLSVRLKAIPGTGYAWHIVRNDPRFLKPLGEPAYEQTDGKLPGGVEFQIFRFRGLARGTNVLELHYVRAWEKKKTPPRTYRIIAEIL